MQLWTQDEVQKAEARDAKSGLDRPFDSRADSQLALRHETAEEDLSTTRPGWDGIWLSLQGRRALAADAEADSSPNVGALVRGFADKLLDPKQWFGGKHDERAEAVVAKTMANRAPGPPPTLQQTPAVHAESLRRLQEKADRILKD